jgi:hypothetical protein
MKRLMLLASLPFLSFAQTPVHDDDIKITADSQLVEGAIRHLSGHVVIETNKMLFIADRADFNEETSKITTHGCAHVKFKTKDVQTSQHSEASPKVSSL